MEEPRERKIYFVRILPEFAQDVSDFLNKNNFEYFDPHPKDVESIREILENAKKDLYVFAVLEDFRILGYGMLRGLDEGYEFPTLGIAIDRSVQGQGLGRKFIEYMHIFCTDLLGVNKVRIGVMKGNDIAKHLYESMGYVFTEDWKDREYGYLDLL